MPSKSSVLSFCESAEITAAITSLTAEVDLYSANSVEKANQLLKEEWIQVAILQLASINECIQFARKIRETWFEVKLILILPREAKIDSLSPELLNNSVICLIMPVENSQIKQAVSHSIELFHLNRENQRMQVELSLLPRKYAQEVERERQFLQAQSEWDQGIVRSASSSMNQVCEMIEHVGPFDVNVVFTGESGTGKELCARSVHANSLRRHGPFIAENCGALPDELLASELFGHKKGAFTGAVSDNTGLFEQANGGTLFLDEVGELSPSFQVKLLRVLQEGEIRPVGSSKYIPVDVRVVAATNRDLQQDVKTGRFREDLYYRLATFAVRLPALRERKEDIATISQVLLQDCMNLLKKRVKGFKPETLIAMRAYTWPGNIRELQNEIKRMLVLAPGDQLTPNLLSAHIQLDPQLSNSISSADSSVSAVAENITELCFNGMQGSLKERVETLEARILQETLDRHRWNKSRAANELGLSRVGLRNKLERYSLDEQDAASGG